jgi:hypothetical protein
MEWYRNDKAAVAEALRRGERPDLATTMASGPLDELVALHEDLGIFAILDELEVQRVRAGVPDELLLRTLATLPFVDQASLSGATEVLFREPAVLLQLGWAPVQIRAGSNGRHRHPEGRQEESLPCHADTLRDALRRVGESAWLHAQQARVQSLYQRQLVRGKVYAVDGSGLGEELRVVALVCVSATRPIIVAWRVLSGTASEKGKEAEVTHALIEHVLEAAGPSAISLLLADALYADGPLLAWLKYRKRIDVLVRLPEDRLLYQDVQGLAAAQLIEWTHHRYVRTVRGHKHIREVEVTAAGDLSSWDGFTEVAATYEVTDATLWALYWLLRTSIRKINNLLFHHPPIFLLHERKRIHREKHALSCSIHSRKPCKGCMRGLPKAPSYMTLFYGCTSSTGCTIQHVVPIQATHW